MKIKYIDKNIKLVIKNSIYVYILNFFCTIVPVLTIPYVTRILGPKGYGEFSVASNIINYFQILVEYGFTLHGARKIAIAKNQEEINKCFSLVFKSRMLLCTISLILFYIYSSFFLSRDLIICSLILFLIVFGNTFQQNWLFQGLQKMQYITIISVISRIISLVLIFTFVKDNKDVYLYCLFYAITNLLVGISGFIIVKKFLHIRLVKVKIKQIIDELKEAKYIFLSFLSGAIITSFGITILGLLDTEYSVGIYSAIYKIPNIIVIMFSPISQALYPFNSKKFLVSIESGVKNVIKITIPIICIFTVLALILASFSKTVIFFVFGQEYSQYHIILKILMFWIIFSILNNFLGIQILTASNNSQKYGKSFSISAIISIVLNILFIKLFSIYGVAITLLISEMILTIILSFQIIIILKKRSYR